MRSRSMSRFVPALLLAFSSTLPSAALAAQSPRVQTLENGLKVVLLEDHTAPIAAAAVWVHIGGKDESDKVAGYSHFLEHLIPQGTKGRPPRAQQLEIFQSGGIASVQADYDRTFFFFSVPKEGLDTALEGLLQLVSQAELSNAAVSRIRPGIKRELKETYDNPAQVLYLEQMRALFAEQPYRVPPAGSFQNLEALDHASADAFYGNFFVANNMVLAVGGDFQAAKLMEKIRARFGTLKPSKALPPKPKFAETTKGARQVVKNLASMPPSVSLLFPTPGYRHPDRPALLVLGRLLQGATGRWAGPSTGIANATGGFSILEERGLLAVTGYLMSPDAAVPATEALARRLVTLRKESFPNAELKRAIKAMRLEEAVRRDGVGALTQELAEATLFGDVRFAWDLPASLDKVTSEDIRRVASTYLVSGKSATLMILPKQEPKPSEEALLKATKAVEGLDSDPAPPAADFARAAYVDKGVPGSRPDPKPAGAGLRYKLPNGLTVVLKPSPGHGLSAVSLHTLAGFAFDAPGKEGTAQMVAAFLPLGADAAAAAAFREQAASLGSSFGLTASVETMEAGLTVFPEDLPAALDLIGRTILSPAFPAEHLDALKEQMNRYRDSLGRMPGPTARELTREKIFRDHPYAHPALGSEMSLQAVTREDLVAFHRRFYRPDRSVLTIAGDFQSDAARAKIAAAFGAWTAGKDAPGDLPDATSPEPLAGQFSRSVDAFPSSTLLAFPGLPLKHPDTPVLRALGTILGARGFVDLVLDQASAFSVEAGLDGFSRGGILTLEATSSPEDASRVAYELLLRARNLALSDMSPQTLNDVRAVENGRLLREKESLYKLASNLGFYELVGPGFATYDDGKTLPAEMTAGGLKEAAGKYLDSAKLVRVSAGPPAR
ncbi:MAG TPA: pitrilysin family protein [Candidatus Polarisedimenticolia bacterium]|nr:pitrilysin family protein [Candidatus Polarisedimenticolia bacterium]